MQVIGADLRPRPVSEKSEIYRIAVIQLRLGDSKPLGLAKRGTL